MYHNKSALEPTALALPMTLTLTFNPLRAMVMTYSHANVQGRRSVGSEVIVETNGRSEVSALPPTLMRSVKLLGVDSYSQNYRRRLDGIFLARMYMRSI